MVTNKGITALQLAAYKGDEPITRLLLEHGADPLAKTENEFTALLMAATAWHRAIVKLLEHGADASARTRSGDTALLVAAEEGHEEITKMLLERGAIAAEQDLCSVLCAAWKSDHKRIFGLVLDSCARISVADKGIAPLHQAAGSGYGGMVKMILEYGVYVSDTQHDGSTALHIAPERRDLEVLEILLSGGADPSAVNGNGCTAFDLAAKSLSEYRTEVSPEVMRWTAHLAKLMNSGTVLKPYDYKMLEDNGN
jgi:ankyrin repeat protein